MAFSPVAGAQERLIKGAPAQLTPLPTPGAVQREDANLVVDDVMIDRTADNAVLAREQAIAEARSQAFRKLAQRHLTPGAYANFRMPDDRTIATLVQDFEIVGEQLSATRYVAKFTVRFRESVRNYINIPYAPRDVASQPVTPTWRQMSGDAAVQPGTETLVIGGGQDDMTGVPYSASGDTLRPSMATTPPANTAPRVAGPALLLPYYENMGGQTVLWEDPNPWRQTWQRMPGSGSGISSQFLNKIVIPLGDIADISAGSSNAVWSGDYGTLEKLRANYGVAQVVLAVANKSGAHMSIDLYFYENGKLNRRHALTPYAGDKPDSAAWQQAMYDVLAYLQRPAPTAGGAVENISRSVVGAQPVPQQVASRPSLVTSAQPYESGMADAGTPAAAAYGSLSGQEVEAMLSFSDFNAWMNVQRRLSAMSPPVRIDIRSLSRNTARFVMRYDGSVPVLQNALAAQGIVMTPSREVTTAYGTPVYDLRLYP
ncbi:MAG: DUF2066 domain-containing protein [Alphaproteobacteria bacterium]|nr:DUF2066 domain-containing protein [Alphaproteobacteria bacterium]